jgi:Na+/H+-translocating membrane pyrophosphatase
MHDGEPTGGLFGTAVATMGMLSTAVYVVSFPPANNATRAQTPTEQS